MTMDELEYSINQDEQHRVPRCELRAKVSFSIRLAAFRANSGSETRHLKPENFFCAFVPWWLNFYFFVKIRRAGAKKVPTLNPSIIILVSLNQWVVNIAKFLLLRLLNGREK